MNKTNLATASQPNFEHVPVMLQEVINALEVDSGETYIDATFGSGGHSQAILAKGGIVYGIDQDEQNIKDGRNRFNGSHLELIHDNFRHLAEITAQNRLESIAGILFDLGVSSRHFDTQSRGFSFNKEAALDMRMDLSLNVTAADLVNALGRKELTKLFRLYGNEAKAKQISEAIVVARRKSPITTTTQLAELIEAVYQHKRGKLHPATKVFQALRMAVNDEVNALKDVLPQATKILKPGGRLVVISFHEGEDRIVKEFFKDAAENELLYVITQKPLVPREVEIIRNPRSRSAKLRIAEKI